MQMQTHTANRGHPAPGIHRWLALGAVAGPIFFCLTYTLLGLLRPGYSLVSQPVSGLGVGPYAPVMNAAFIIMGVLIFMGAIGICQNMNGLGPVAKWNCMILLALSPTGAIICGLYTFETFSLHFLGFFLACGTPVICYPAVGLLLRRIPYYRRFGSWMMAGSPLTLILIGWFMATFDYLHTDVGTAGLIERVLILEVHGFYVAFGWLVFRRKS